MFVRELLLVTILATCSSLYSQTNGPSSGKIYPGFQDLEKNMMIYLNLNAMEELSMEELVSRSQAKMWKKEKLDLSDTRFLMESGIIQYLFTDAYNEPDIEKKGKKIYQIEALLEQDLPLNSQYAELLVEYKSRLEYVKECYSNELNKVVPYVLRRDLASYLGLPERTPLDELLEKSVDRILSNGIKMSQEDLGILLDKKLYRYLSVNNDWEKDSVIIGIMLLYNTDEFGISIGGCNFEIITEVLARNEILSSESMNMLLSFNGKNIPASESLLELRKMIQQKTMMSNQIKSIK